METEEKKLTSSEIDQMLEEAAAYHVESKEPSNKNKKNKKKKKKRKQIRFDIIIAIVLAVVVVVEQFLQLASLQASLHQLVRRAMWRIHLKMTNMMKLLML